MPDLTKTVLNRTQIARFLDAAEAAVQLELERFNGDGTDVQIIKGMPAQLRIALRDKQTLCYQEIGSLVEKACDESSKEAIGSVIGMAKNAAMILTPMMEAKFLDTAQTQQMNEKL